MKTCHLNDYPVVGPCFPAKFSEKTNSDISQAWENTTFVVFFNIIERILFMDIEMFTKELSSYMDT